MKNIKGFIALAILLLIIGLIEKVGFKGVVFIVISIIVVYYFYQANENKLPIYPTDEFGPIYPNARIAQQYLALVMKKKSFNEYAKLLALHQIRESFEIALNTKKIKTAESRIEYAQERFRDILEMNIPTQEKDLIKSKFSFLMNEYTTKKYLIEINAAIDKIKTLKTKKSKDKYYNTAKEYILTAKADKDINIEEIHAIEDYLNKVYKENKL